MAIFNRDNFKRKTIKKPENAILIRFPAFKQQPKERSPLLSPKIMTHMLSHSMSPPGHSPRGFSPAKSISSGRLLSGLYFVEKV